MVSATFHFHQELNDFLEPSRRKRDVDAVFPERRSVKDLVESFGVGLEVKLTSFSSEPTSVQIQFFACEEVTADEAN